MTVLTDGTFLFAEGEPLPLLPYHYADPENPRHYIPKFDPCCKRKYETKVSSCGKVKGRWMCLLDEETVSVPSCAQCQKIPLSLQRAL